MVHIERLECKGFKSFGRKKISIKFNPGFTCIVGPNGSGKSNVVDAILFVLGQLSAKTLRANVFADLLYSPPKPNMPPEAKSATVKLHFNNRDRKLQVESDKVVIERELDESGRSTCRVNGKVVTRSTVVDILGGIGVDPNGYNLVLQGEIAQIVKSSPTQRRELIEEIAGISAYDEQKEKALKKLTESENNLGKVEMQLRERQRQLDKLEEERGDALQYQKTRQLKRETRIDSLAWNIVKSASRIKTIKETLAEKGGEFEQLEKELRDTIQKIENTEKEIGRMDDEIDQIAGEDSARISERFGVVSAAVEHLREELDEASRNLDEAKERKERKEEKLERIREEIQELNEKHELKQDYLEEVTEEVSSLEIKIERLEERFEEEQSNYYRITQELQQFNNKMRSLDESIAQIRSTIKSNNRELGYAYEELRDSKESLERVAAEMTHLEKEIPENVQNIEQMETSERSKRNEFKDIEEQLERVNAEVDETANVMSSTREELIRLQARQDALKEAEESFLKRREAVARVLELRDAGAIEGIHGTVAELGTIDPDYAVAMEIAGGSRLSYVVVENEETATKCIDALKSERVGRASFIPLNKIKTRSPRKLPDDEGVIGFALNLVDFDPKFRPAFEFTFSDTLITEDFETTKRMGFSGWRAVSLEGDIVERSGLVTGGHYQQKSRGLTLQVKDESPQIIEKLKGLKKILSDLRAKQESLRNRKEQLDKEINQLGNEKYRQEIKLDRLKGNLSENKERGSRLTERIRELNVTIEELESQTEELQEKDEQLTNERNQVRRKRDDCNEKLAKSDAAQINQDLKDLKKVLEHEKQKREKTEKEITKIRLTIDERLSPRANELASDIESIERTLPEMKKNIIELEEKLTKKKSEYQDLQSKREEIEDAVKDKRVYQLELKEEVRNLRLRHEEIREEQTSNEKAVYRLQTEQSKLEEEIVAFSAELDEIADKDEELEKRRQAEELTYSEIEDLEEEVKEFQRELEEMGPVNLKALTDYDIEKEKYNEIVEKKVRLEEEHKEILSFMEELEQEKTRKFLEVYNEIADNFSEVFAKLSPGGEAHLMLENPEHPLMGGITVKSKPRGKDLVSLEAMSGGEKTITGLALIFSIQMYNPASFYIFDEIDAALDDVNAHSVATLISEMSKTSQFIVISLRDTTVRKADKLVGVSNRDGLSNIVAVDLEEVASTA